MPRTIQLHVMLSEEEMASLRSLSDSIDMTVSDTVRILIQAGENSGPVGLAMLVFDRKTLVRYVRNVRSLGHLLNQSTHALNYIAKAVRESGVDALDLTEALDGVSRELEELKRDAEAIRQQRARLADAPVVYER